ncbi:unnamed protein product [Mortierella alpina]
MPIPFTATHTPLAASLSTGTDASAQVGSSSSGHRLNPSSTHARSQTQALEGGSTTRRWSRLQRRSPINSGLSAYHHSPRSRYISGYAQSSNHHHLGSRVERQHTSQLLQPLHQQSPLQRSRDFDMVAVGGHQQGVSSILSASVLSTTATIAQRTASAVEQRLYSQARFPPEVPMDSSNPTESMATFMAISARALSSTPMQRSPSNNPSMASNTVPTEVASVGDIATATAAPDSISVSVSTSTGQPPPHSPHMMAHVPTATVPRAADAIMRDQTPPPHPPFTAVTGNLNVTHSDWPHERTDGLRQREGRGSLTAQVDDRIHFRLLDDTSLRSDPVPQLRHSLGRHDDDLGMDSPPLSTERYNQSHATTRRSAALQYIDLQDSYMSDTDSASSEDEIMRDSDGNVNLSHRQSSSFWRQYQLRHRREAMVTNSNAIAAVARHRRPFSSNHHPELIEEEEEGTHFGDVHSNNSNDDSDELDFPQLGENGYRHYQSRYRQNLTDLHGLTPSGSDLEHPHHAQLSPRSAAALTRMFSMSDRPSWSQRHFIDSSITPELEALSQQGSSGAQSMYDRNPHFRRPLPMPSSSYSRSARLGSSAPHNGSGPRSNIMNRDPMETETAQTTLGHGDTNELPASSEARSRSVSTQYDLNVSVGDRSWTFRREGSIDSRAGCGDSPPTSGGTEMIGNVWPLKFDMYYADGGEFNAAHAVENVLKNDSSVYCSRRPANINICLKLAEPHQTFVLTRFSAKAPTNGFTAPCKEGLIFVSHNPIPLEKTRLFDNMTREDYEKYVDTINQGSKLHELLQQHGAGADALIPAAFFQIKEDDKTCVLDFSPNRSGRYVLIKLLRSRCENGLQRPENIDLQYLGLIGFTGARSFASGGLL